MDLIQLKRFKISDVFQQMIGSFLLATPFIVEGGVWDLARNMNSIQTGLVTAIVLFTGYAALYKADKTRNAAEETKILFLPVRFISLIFFSYTSVILLAYLLAAPTTYGATAIVTLKAISIAAISSVIGAATADSVF